MQSEQQRPVSQRLWLVGVVADVAAVVTLLASSTGDVAVVLGIVALLLGTVQLVASFGKPVDRWVVLAVVGIVAGAVTMTVVITRGVVTPAPQAGGGTPVPSTTAVSSPATTSQPATTSKPVPTTRPPSVTGTARPAEKRVSDKPVLLTEGYTLDLDSDGLDWGSTPLSSNPSGPHDLRYSAYSLLAPKHLAPVKRDATFEDCVTAGYREHVYGSAEIGPGKAFCVKTTEGSYARVVVTEVDPGVQVAMTVLVWQPSTS
ncbi:hypothetical protein [Allokutzneria albata]|uniref:Uncharacterized protein n=1 Tax=Allokutzneria albata TaxID=211114 RepID=A0A1G9TET7_ALLAB|nr:hypothetical protein [Allokutzneria albata]SDM46180.1 hypothetical protein SAMN04489726_1742 [Allokutzneria albata]